MIETLRPNAPGDETNLAKNGAGGDNYDRVDEVVADESGTYVYNLGYTTYLRDLYHLPASSIPDGATINFIKIYFRCRTAVDLGGWAKPSLKSDTTVSDGTEILLNAWGTYSQQWNTNPADSEAWEKADINALQIGVSLKKDPHWTYCTQVYVEVDYTPAAYHLDITINGEGLVLPEDVSGDYWEGAVIGLTASPAPGWWFHSWEGTDNDSLNPTTVTMDGDRHVVCNFTQEARAGCLPVVAAGVVFAAGIIALIVGLLCL